LGVPDDIGRVQGIPAVKKVKNLWIKATEIMKLNDRQAEHYNVQEKTLALLKYVLNLLHQLNK